MFLSYVLSFVYVGIYWNNHHHMLHACTRVTGSVLWANLHLLFWLSLFPFATGWMGENHFAPMPSALYGVVLLMAAIAYWMLQQTHHRVARGTASVLKTAVGSDWKGKLSPVALCRRHRVHVLGAMGGSGAVCDRGASCGSFPTAGSSMCYRRKADPEILSLATPCSTIGLPCGVERAARSHSSLRASISATVVKPFSAASFSSAASQYS